MKEFNFTEATPLLIFFEAFKDKIIGKRLKNLFTMFWPEYNRSVTSCESVILEINSYFAVIDYTIPSKLKIVVGTKEEISQDRFVAEMLHIKDDPVNYYGSAHGSEVKQEKIENCKITKIGVERFSHSFECNPCTGEGRPEGGDYFATIRLYLDSGTVLCICGASSICDGGTEVWCE